MASVTGLALLGSCLPSNRSPDLNPVEPYRIVSIHHGSQGKSEAPAISGDGQYVTFVRLTEDSTKTRRGGKSEIYLHHVKTGTTTLVSKALGGGQANANSGTPVLNDNGRYTVFDSLASNLTAEDQNGHPDIFVYDRETDEMTLVSVDSTGRQGNADSFDPWISGNGRYVAFASDATNLVEGDLNNEMDVFVHDRETGMTSRVSRGPDGMQSDGSSYSPSLSFDGRYVAFESYSSNLVSGDTNDRVDVFIHDRETRKTVRVSVASDHREGNDHSVAPFISGDGRFVVFQSYASNLVEGDTNGHPDIFLHDLRTRTTSRLSLAPGSTEANSESYFPSISYDGRYVAFHSVAWNLVPDDTNVKSDVFIHDRADGKVRRISLAHDSSQANGGSYSPIICGNGSYVTFVSNATNLIDDDGPARTGVFVASVP